MEKKHPSVLACLLSILLGLSACGSDKPKNSPVAALIESCRLTLSLDHQFDPRDEIDSLRDMARQSPGLDSLERLGWRYMSLARDGDGSAALFLTGQTVDCMLDRDPDSLQAILLQANYRHQLHDFAGAEALARQLVQRRGSWFDYAVLGDALTEQGRLHAAAGAYQSMVDLKPGAESYGRIAHLRWLNRDQEGAMEMMVLAIRAQDNRDRRAAAWWRTGLAGYLFDAGRPDEALAVVDRSLSLHTQSHAAHFLRARVLKAMDRVDEAIDAMDTAVALNPLPHYEQIRADWMPAVSQESFKVSRKQFSPRA